MIHPDCSVHAQDAVYFDGTRSLLKKADVQSCFFFKAVCILRTSTILRAYIMLFALMVNITPFGGN